MKKHAVGMAVAAAFATAMVSAQTTGQGQDQATQSAGARQQVSIEGCLQQEQRAEAQDRETPRSSETQFVLHNAQVKSGSEPSSATAAGTSAEATGTQAAGQADRPTGQAGTETPAPVGTSGTAATAAYSAGSYRIVGLDDDRLKLHAGERVRLEGHIEMKEHDADRPGAGATDRSEAGAAAGTQPTGTASTGIAGHGQAGTTAGAGTEVGATGTAGTAGIAGAPGAPGAQGAHDHSRMGSAGAMKEFRGTSIERVSGSCPEAK